MRRAHKTTNPDEALAEKIRNDPLLQLVGSGRGIWSGTEADTYIEQLRGDDLSWWTPPPHPLPPLVLPPPATKVRKSTNTGVRIVMPISQAGLFEAVWARVKRHEGEVFRTARQLPITYAVDGDGLFFHHGDGRRINMRTSGREWREAVLRCPLEQVADVASLRNPSYLYALLTDPRIRAKDW